MTTNSIAANEKRRVSMLRRWQDPLYIKKHLARGMTLRKGIPHYCIDCGKENDHRSERCLSCGIKYRYAQPGNKPTFGKTYEEIFGDERASEIRARMSESRMGNKNHFYGKHHTEETKEKLREHFKGILPWGGNCPDSVRGKISESAKQRYKDNPESNPIYGKPRSEETKRKIGDGNKGKIISEEQREILRELRLGATLSEETKAKIKAYWSDPEYVAKQMKSRGVKPNKKELALDAIIRQLNLPYSYVGDGQFILAGKCPDFLNINSQKKLIELYGNWWHRNDDPQERIDLFAKFGYSTLIIWESELKDPEAVKEKLQQFDKAEVH